MTRMTELEWESPLLEPLDDPEALRLLRRENGRVPSGAYYFLDSPWFTRALAAFDLRTLPLAHTPHSLSGLVALVISQDNSCRYCYAATRGLMQILGYPGERIRQLEEDLQTAELSHRDRLAIDFARRVSRANPPAGFKDARPLLDGGYSVDAVKELAVLAVVNVFFNRVSTLSALPPEEAERMPNLWYVRLFRPLIALAMSRDMVKGGPVPLTPEQRRGPFASLVNALDPLPTAARLRAVIDAAFESPVLSRRSKALVFAIVARGIGDAASEAEARSLLAGEGFGPEKIERILNDLTSPDLDPIENAMLPLARETVWYRPAPIQRHARQVRSAMSREQFVEVIGVAALANSVCRLGAALDVAQSVGGAETQAA